MKNLQKSFLILGLFLGTFLTGKSYGFTAVNVGVGVRVGVAVAVPYYPRCGGSYGCGMPMPMPTCGSHGGCGGGFGYGGYPYGGGFGGGYGYGFGQPQYQYGNCGRCHKRIHKYHGRKRCGCNGRRGFALNIRVGGFGLGLRTW